MNDLSSEINRFKWPLEVKKVTTLTSTAFGAQNNSLEENLLGEKIRPRHSGQAQLVLI